MILKAGLGALASWSALSTPSLCQEPPGQRTLDDLLELREPVPIAAATLAELRRTGEGYAFEAWIAADVGGGSVRLLPGIAIATGEPKNGSGPSLAAYCTLCPHEACEVRLERDPEVAHAALEDGAELPAGPVFLCACHFSVFEAQSSGALISGPAFRGLYRFRMVARGDGVEITHVEKGVLDLYG